VGERIKKTAMRRLLGSFEPIAEKTRLNWHPNA
jgi:hypothetical protein